MTLIWRFSVWPSTAVLRQCERAGRFCAGEAEAGGPVGEAGKIAKLEGFPYQSVVELRLDFRNILKIENLWQFVGLTKLQLDNNIIEVIAGIEKLVNLTWLDLSFNHIENIEGENPNITYVT